MFEVNVFTPAQFGAFVSWLVMYVDLLCHPRCMVTNANRNRGPLSALVHPNHDDGDFVRDHTQRATWLGEKIVLDVGLLRKFA
jgi:aromatic ring-cleaving dioxygenase